MGFFSVCIYIYTLSAHVHLVLCDATVHFPTYPLYIYTYIHIKYHVTNGSTTQNKNTKKKACCFQNNVSFKLKMSHCPLAFRHCPVFTPLTCRTTPLKWLRTRDYKSHHRAYSASKRKQTIFTSLSSFSQLRNRSKLGYPPHL